MNLQEKVKCRLLAELGAGKFPVGSILPTVRELSEQYNASIYTISIVLNQLAKEKLVSSRRGSKTQVLSLPRVDHGNKGKVCLNILDHSAFSERKAKQMILNKLFDSGFRNRHPDVDIKMKPVAYLSIQNMLNCFFDNNLSISRFQATQMNFLIDYDSVAQLPESLMAMHSQILPELCELGSRNGKHYFLPYTFSHLHLSVKRSALASIGCPEKAVFYKRCEWIEILREIRRFSKAAPLYLPYWSDLSALLAFFYMQEAPDCVKISWTSPEMEKVIKWLIPLIFDEKLIELPHGSERRDPAEFVCDDHAMTIDSGMWRLNNYQNPSDLMVLPFPDTDDGQRLVLKNAVGWCINQHQSAEAIEKCGQYLVEFEDFLWQHVGHEPYTIFNGHCCRRNVFMPNGKSGVQNITGSVRDDYELIAKKTRWELPGADWEKEIMGNCISQIVANQQYAKDPKYWMQFFKQSDL
jgi:hypothetical protein